MSVGLLDRTWRLAGVSLSQCGHLFRSTNCCVACDMTNQIAMCSARALQVRHVRGDTVIMLVTRAVLWRPHTARRSRRQRTRTVCIGTVEKFPSKNPAALGNSAERRHSGRAAKPDEVDCRKFRGRVFILTT